MAKRYTVKKGEDLVSLSKKLGVSAGRLLAANPDIERIVPGLTLKLPGVQTLGQEAPGLGGKRRKPGPPIPQPPQIPPQYTPPPGSYYTPPPPKYAPPKGTQQQPPPITYLAPPTQLGGAPAGAGAVPQLPTPRGPRARTRPVYAPQAPITQPPVQPPAINYTQQLAQRYPYVGLPQTELGRWWQTFTQFPQITTPSWVYDWTAELGRAMKYGGQALPEVLSGRPAPPYPEVERLPRRLPTAMVRGAGAEPRTQEELAAMLATGEGLRPETMAMGAEGWPEFGAFERGPRSNIIGYLLEQGIRPTILFEEYVKERGWTDEELRSYGYEQTQYGDWISVEMTEAQAETLGVAAPRYGGGGYGYPYYGGGGRGASFEYPSRATQLERAGEAPQRIAERPGRFGMVTWRI